jgi:hypothetical protein
MTPDVGRLMRLRGTIRATIDAAADYEHSNGAVLVEAYQAARAELRATAGEELAEELDRVVPDRSFGGDEMWQDKYDFENAKLMLSRLAGWTAGLIEEAQYSSRLAAEAEALAEARIKEERGIGSSTRSMRDELLPG